MFMPDFIRNLDEWIIWLLAEEFHQSATIPMIVQRTGYSEGDVVNAIGVLERMKAIKVVRSVSQATKVERIGLVPNGQRIHDELKRRSGT